jgi:ATP-dependent Lon protease
MISIRTSDIHIHLPEGATPKDGPSVPASPSARAGFGADRYSGACDVAMTGEITLRGEVLPIGGLKEKLLAAVRGGIRLALIPEENVKDLAEIPDNIKNRIEIQPVRWIDKVLELALDELLKLRLGCFFEATPVHRVLSSVGRASPLQGECRRFDPVSTHQRSKANLGSPFSRRVLAA